MPTVTSEDKVEVSGKWKIIHVRQVTIATEDDVETDRTYHRRVIVPGDDVSTESNEIRTLAAEHHTDELLSRYENYLEDPINNG